MHVDACVLWQDAHVISGSISPHFRLVGLSADEVDSLGITRCRGRLAQLRVFLLDLACGPTGNEHMASALIAACYDMSQKPLTHVI